jgi:hypothetical protein
MLRSVALLISSLSCCAVLYGQVPASANIRFFAAPEVDRIMQGYTSTNRSTTTVRGWRLQILSTSDRERMEQTRNTFRMQFPYIPVSYVHNRPYYLLRVGAFTDQRDAIRIQYLIRPFFPSTYLVQDNEIKVTELFDAF